MGEANFGVDLQDLRVGAKTALRQAAQMQFRTVEVPASQGETTPQNLSPSGRRHLQKMAADLGLSIASLTADFAGLRLSDPKTVDERVDRTLGIIELATDLSVPIVTASVGALTHPESGEPSEVAVAALQQLGEFADARGRVLAIRPSHDSVERLAAVLEAVRCPWLKIGLDPAAMLMAGVNPLGVVEQLGPHVTLVHMRDAFRGTQDRSGQETRLGEGELDLSGLVSALREMEFTGPTILRRVDSLNPSSDLISARDVLRRIV